MGGPGSGRKKGSRNKSSTSLKSMGARKLASIRGNEMRIGEMLGGRVSQSKLKSSKSLRESKSGGKGTSKLMARNMAVKSKSSLKTGKQYFGNPRLRKLGTTK